MKDAFVPVFFSFVCVVSMWRCVRVCASSVWWPADLGLIPGA